MVNKAKVRFNRGISKVTSKVRFDITHIQHLVCALFSIQERAYNKSFLVTCWFRKSYKKRVLDLTWG